MPSAQVQLAQDDFASGMERDVAPHLIDGSGAYDLENFLLDEDGNPYKRGGTTYQSNAGLGSSGLTWLWNGYLSPGRRTVFANSADFGVLDSDDQTPKNLGGAGLSAPKQAAAINDYLFIGGGAIYAGSRKTASYSTGTVSLTNGATTVTGVGTSFSANVDEGMLLQFGNERVYRVASVTDNTHLEIAEAYAGTTKAGSGYTLYPLYTVTNADPYEGYDYLTACANKLVVGSGRVVKFTALDANGHADPHSFAANDYHRLPEGANVLGLATVGQTVVIFTTAGIWTLDGLAYDIVDANGDPQHRLNALSRDLILSAAPGIASYQQALVAPCASGVYLLDGVSEPQKVSRPIDPLYRKWHESGYRAGQAVVFRGHLFLPIVTGSATVKDLLVCRLERPTRSRSQVGFPWTRFTGDGGEIPAFATSHDESTRQPKLLGAQSSSPSRVLECSSYFSPASANKLDADGSAFSASIITRDFETGGLTENVVAKIRGRYELVDAATDNPRLALGWADGMRDPEAPAWGDPAGAWGTGFGPSGTSPWTDGVDAEFDAVACVWDESDGRKRKTARLGKRVRYVRLRVSCDDPAAKLTMRSLELLIRPSNAARR